MKKVTIAMQSAAGVYDRSSEIYNFELGCRKYGKEVVLTEDIKEIQQERRCTFADAAIVAAERFKLMEDLATSDRFKRIRLKLDAEALAPSCVPHLAGT